MRILVINGANINMLSRRGSVYGNISYQQLCDSVREYATSKAVTIDIQHSNSEGGIIDIIQSQLDTIDGLIINAGAYTHYSYAIRDCLEYVPCIVVEVHLSDIDNRESFRQQDVLMDVVDKRIMGEGIVSYHRAIDYLLLA